MVLVSRKAAQWICGLGLMQLFFSTALIVCGFVVLGLFNKVTCIGLWLGFPALAPGLISVIVLGTRHRTSAFTVYLTSLVATAIGAWHMVEVYEEVDFWEKYRGYAETMATLPLCYHNGFHCLCHDKEEYVKSGYTVQFCDQFRVGEELYWTMFVLSIGIVIFSLLNAVLSIVATFTGKDEDEK